MVRCLRLFLVVAVLVSTVAIAQAQDAAKKLRVLLVSGSFEYESHKTLPILQKYLESQYPVDCKRAFATSETDLPGLENLDKADVMVLFTRRLKLQGTQLERIKKYCLSGKPIVGIRTASHAIQTWLDLDKDVLGGNYKGHFGTGPKTTIKVAHDHAILKGFKAFASEGTLYKNKGHAKDIDVLLTGAIPGQEEAIAWTRISPHKARVFYTSLGHQKDFEEPSFLRLVGNAVLWSAGREAEIK